MPPAALLVDENGTLTVSTSNGSGTWSTPVGVGNAGLSPGAGGALLSVATDVLIVLMVDTSGTSGTLTAIELDLSSGVTQQSTVPIGAPTFPPGAPIGLVQQSKTSYAAVLVDLDGMLNVANVDLSGPTPSWTGPDAIGNGNLVPGSHLTVVAQGTSAISVLVVDRDGLLNIATLQIASGSWQGPIPVGNTGLVPGSYVSVLPGDSA
jgi:hypothetical protein